MLLWILAALAAPFDTVDQAATPAAKADALMGLTAGDETGPEAWARLGDLLADEGLHALANIAYAKGLVGHPELAASHGAQAMISARAVDDVGLIVDALKDLPSAPGQGDEASENAYRLALELLRDDALSASQAWLERVGKDSPSFADAESLRGVVLAAKGQHEAALVPLQTAKALGVTMKKGERFDQKLTLNIARTYYAQKNYGQAIYNYSLVPRSSAFWADARFEKAWAHFRADDPAGAVGELQTHISPFFDELWFPEAHMLRAQALYSVCRFATAIEAMDDFERRFKPVFEALDRALPALNGESTWTAVTTYLDTHESGALPAMALRTYREEDRIQQARASVAAYEAAASTGLGASSTQMGTWARSRAAAIRGEEGGRILARLKNQQTEIGQMMSGLELARVDLLDRESRMYSAAAAGGKLGTISRTDELKVLAREKKGHRVWPYQGEVWLDELGWYQVNARSACPEKP